MNRTATPSIAISVARSGRGKFHISREGDPLVPLCGTKTDQGRAFTIAEIDKPLSWLHTDQDVYEKFDSLPFVIRCDKCLDKALRVAFGGDSG